MLLVLALSCGGANEAKQLEVPVLATAAVGLDVDPATSVPTATAAPAPTATSTPEPAPVVVASPAPRAAAAPVAAGPPGSFVATHYGESYNGSPLGCGGVYSSDNPDIVATGAALSRSVGCGRGLMICGSAGCILAHRRDYCPGCDAYGMIDLSEAGQVAVCGAVGNNCRVSVEILPP